MGWKVGLYSAGAGGNDGDEGPDHVVWLTSFAFFSSCIRSSILFFFWAKVGCMIRLIAMEMTEELFRSVRRSATFSTTAPMASASVSLVTLVLVVMLTLGRLIWGSHEWVMLLFGAGFLRRFHGEHELWVFVLIVPILFFSLSHYPSLFDPLSVVCI